MVSLFIKHSVKNHQKCLISIFAPKVKVDFEDFFGDYKSTMKVAFLSF